MKFGSDVPYQMIKVYQTAIENFVKGRPREVSCDAKLNFLCSILKGPLNTPWIIQSQWAQLNGFRATRVEMELNYIEYVIVATHREMWQNIAPILQSKADLASFSLEVSKKLNLRYENPPKPVHLSMHNEKKKKKAEEAGKTYDLSEIQQVARLFGKGVAEGGDE